MKINFGIVCEIELAESIQSETVSEQIERMNYLQEFDMIYLYLHYGFVEVGETNLSLRYE